MSAKNLTDQPPESPTVSFAQLRIFKGLSVLLTILLLGVVGLYYYKQRQVQPVSVLVNGATVAVATNYSAAASIVASMKQVKGFTEANEPQVTELVTFVRIPDSQPVAIDPDDALRSKMAAAIHVTVKASVITIDSKAVLGLPTEDLANETLAAVKKHYADMPPDKPLVSDPTFREAVTIVDNRVPASMTCPGVASAVKFLIAPPPPKTYIVGNHETGWSIARKFHIPFGKFLLRNAARNINRLKIGDTVNLYGGAPPVTVIVVKRSQTVQAIRSGAPSSSAGSRRLDIETTYINGVANGTPLTLGITTLQRASPAYSLD